MDAKKLEILLTAVDLGSFSRASEVVGYTQSGLTHLVNSLEKEMGVQLIKRTHNGVSLTAEGEILMPAIRDFLRANANLENRINEVKKNKNETIRIAAYSSMAMHWMPEILYRFRRICPGVDVDLRMVDHALEPFELLEQGKADVIFASKQNYGNCEWTPLYDETMYAILPKNYPINSRKTFPISDFKGQEFLMPYGKFDIDVNAAFKRAGISTAVKTPHVDDETLIRMVGRGLGLSIMAELMIRGRADEALCVPLEPNTIRELGMGMAPAESHSESINKLKNCVISYIDELKSNK